MADRRWRAAALLASSSALYLDFSQPQPLTAAGRTGTRRRWSWLLAAVGLAASGVLYLVSTARW